MGAFDTNIRHRKLALMFNIKDDFSIFGVNVD